jgi:uncharacterized repeat protein (TIGR01451 family)
VTVDVDTTAPTLVVLTPAPGSTLATSAVLLQGTAQDATSGLEAVTCNGAAATVTGTSFSCALTLAAGANAFTVRATDRAGNVTTTSVGLTFTPPTTPVTPSAPLTADVSVTTTVSPTSAAPGQQVVYSIVARNAGPESATSVVVTASLASGLDFVSVGTSAGSCAGTTSIRCNLGSLAANASATITLVAVVRAAGDASASVGASATEADPNLANNVGSAVVVVGAGEPPVAQPPADPVPVQGVYAVVRPVSGTVLVNGRPLADLVRIPIGARVDVRKGKIELRTTNGRGLFSAGQFRLKQARSRGAATELTLVANVAAACRSTARRSLAANKKPSEKKVVARLWGESKGKFRTTARYSSATVRGTVWVTIERCDGSLTSVRRGVVAVYDKVKRKTVLVRAGRSYLATARTR